MVICAGLELKECFIQGTVYCCADIAGVPEVMLSCSFGMFWLCNIYDHAAVPKVRFWKPHEITKFCYLPSRVRAAGLGLACWHVSLKQQIIANSETSKHHAPDLSRISSAILHWKLYWTELNYGCKSSIRNVVSLLLLYVSFFLPLFFACDVRRPRCVPISFQPGAEENAQAMIQFVLAGLRRNSSRN